jgi:hypothetical protein
MAAKCRYCKESLSTSSAYRVEEDGKRMYFCSEDHYKKYDNIRLLKKQDEENKNSSYDIISSIFGYKLQNTALFKEWRCWNEIADNKKILQYLKDNQDYLTQVMKKDFSSEYGKIRYFSTIIKNSIADFKPKAEEQIVKVSVDETFYDFVPTVSKKRRRSLADLEDDI